MTRYGMLIDTTNCIGCFACRTACQRQNGQDPEVDYIRYEERETGTLPFVHHETVPLQCMHCEDAPCEAVCPTHATYTTDSGVVLVDEERCIGCKYCMAACPYQVRTRNSKTGEVDKCRFCTLSSYENGTKMCSCVDACLTGARIFGDLDDSDSEISKEIARTGAAPIAGDLTRAKIYYVR